MKETFRLLFDRGYLVAASSLGYMINMKTGKALFGSKETGQVCIPIRGGGSEFVVLRQEIALTFGIIEDYTTYVWHLDNNPFNCAAANLAATTKKSHKKGALNKAWREFDKGTSLEVIDKQTGLGMEFLKKAQEHWVSEERTPYVWVVSERWVEERLELINHYLLALDRPELVLELVPDFEMADREGASSIVGTESN